MNKWPSGVDRLQHVGAEASFRNSSTPHLFVNLLRRSARILRWGDCSPRTTTTEERGDSDSRVELLRTTLQRRSRDSGQTIRLNGRNYTVIGVLPAWFQYPHPAIQLWVPWQVGESRTRYRATTSTLHTRWRVSERVLHHPRLFRRSALSSMSSTLAFAERDRWSNASSQYRCSRIWWAT